MPIVLVALVALLAASALAIDAGLLWTSRTQLQGAVDAAALAAAASLIDPTVPAVTVRMTHATAADAVAARQRRGSGLVGHTDGRAARGLGSRRQELRRRRGSDRPEARERRQRHGPPGREPEPGRPGLPLPGARARDLQRERAGDCLPRLRTDLSTGHGSSPHHHRLLQARRLELRRRLLRHRHRHSAEPLLPRRRRHPGELPRVPPDAGTERLLDRVRLGQLLGQPAGPEDIIRDGNATTVGVEPIYVDNGTKTPVVDIINEKFHGTTGSTPEMPSGTDTDGDGEIDSWVVGLPVVECQNPGSTLRLGYSPADRRRSLLRHQ